MKNLTLTQLYVSFSFMVMIGAVTLLAPLFTSISIFTTLPIGIVGYSILASFLYQKKSILAMGSLWSLSLLSGNYVVATIALFLIIGTQLNLKKQTVVELP